MGGPGKMKNGASSGAPPPLPDNVIKWFGLGVGECWRKREVGAICGACAGDDFEHFMYICNLEYTSAYNKSFLLCTSFLKEKNITENDATNFVRISPMCMHACKGSPYLSTLSPHLLPSLPPTPTNKASPCTAVKYPAGHCEHSASDE